MTKINDCQCYIVIVKDTVLYFIDSNNKNNFKWMDMEMRI